jgi:hypothetical protein
MMGKRAGRGPDREEETSMTTQIRRLSVVLAVIGVIGTMSGSALADPPAESGVVARTNAVTGGFFYLEDGLIVLTGADEFIDGCLEETQGDFAERTIVTTTPGNGSFQERINYHNEPLLVFDTDVMSIPEFGAWAAAGCEAFLDDDPATMPPEPVATGTGRLDSHVQVDADGTARIHNGVVGRVTTTDGRDVHLRTFVKLTVTDGMMDIQQLIVDYGG